MPPDEKPPPMTKTEMVYKLCSQLISSGNAVVLILTGGAAWCTSKIFGEMDSSDKSSTILEILNNRFFTVGGWLCATVVSTVAFFLFRVHKRHYEQRINEYRVNLEKLREAVENRGRFKLETETINDERKI